MLFRSEPSLKPQASTGVAATGTRRATEFRIAIESIGDRGVREELDLLFPPSGISVRTGLRLEPVPSRSISPSNLSTLPSCPSPSGKPSRVSKSTTHTPEIYDFSRTLAFTRSDTDCFQTHEVPVIFLHPQEGLLPSGTHIGTIYAQIHRCISRRFRPGLVSQGAQGLQTSAKGTTSRASTPPQPQLIRDRIPLVRLLMITLVP